MTAALSDAEDDSFEEENNNQFLYNLKPVFEACDYHGDGYVKVQDLLELGQQHTAVDGTRGDELSLILMQLDGNGDGRISFDEFNEKVSQLLQSSPRNSNTALSISPEIYSPVKIMFSEEHRARSYTDSEGFFEENDIGSNSTTSMNDLGDLEDIHNSSPHNKVKCVKPSNYFDSIKRNSSIYSTYPPNGKRPRKSQRPSFELQRRQLSRTSEYRLQEEGIEAYGDSNNWTHELSPIPLNDSQFSISNTCLSGNLIAHRIREVQSARNSLHGSMEDMVFPGRHSFSDGEGDFAHLSEEIKNLSSQVVLMKIDQESHNDKQVKLREDNRMLVSRINVLEEQLIDQKNNSLDAVEQESQKYRKQLNKIQRDHVESIDELQIKVRETELEIEQLKSVEPMLKKEIENSHEERRLAQETIETLQKEIIEKEKEIEHLKYKLKSKCEELDRERNEHADEIVSLNEELENLKYMKHEALNQFGEHNNLLQKMDLLKKDNHDLKTTRDELRNQLLQKRTMLDLDKDKSLADELITADKGDVLIALRAQEKENHRLKQYVDQLLILIMQNNPILLEK